MEKSQSNKSSFEKRHEAYLNISSFVCSAEVQTEVDQTGDGKTEGGLEV
jgi:hypothetical protein